jgi:hypothetical protein
MLKRFLDFNSLLLLMFVQTLFRHLYMYIYIYIYIFTFLYLYVLTY